jgi:hypothetical protein
LIFFILGYGFFSKKNILIPNVAKKNILILVEEKKNNLIQSFCHIKYTLYIANSRIGSDANIGERTYKDATVVDYLILSSNLFSLITNFEIDEFVPLYSLVEEKKNNLIQSFCHIK